MRFRARAGLAPAAWSLLVLASCAGPAATGSRAPESAKVLLQVRSNPSGARIIFDGKPTGFRTPTAFPAPPGEHRVTISLAGHRNAEVRLRLEPGKPQGVEATLAPLASGALRMDSLPAGAAVVVDGEPVNQVTPALVENLAVGTHTVELRRSGSEDWVQAVVITEGRTLPLQAVLLPARRSLGAVDVRSQPPGAAISIDGYPTGKRTPAHVAALPPGSHRVDLDLRDHQPWRGTTLVREGQTENLLVTLRHRRAEEAGRARIQTDPPGATITMDGVVLRQKTPADLNRLAPGSFTLVLSRPGSRPWTGEMLVAPGKLATIDVRLDPEEACAVSPQPGRGRSVGPAYTIAVSVGAARDAELELSFVALGPGGAPAAGVLELGVAAAAGSWRERKLTLVDGRARGLLVPAATGEEISITVGLGNQCEAFVVRRTTGGWSVATPEP